MHECISVCARGSLSFIPAEAKIYPFRIPVGHSPHQKCFTAPAKSIFLLKTRESRMARACQYSGARTDKSGTEEREPARPWIMLAGKVDKGSRKGWASRRESPFMSSSGIERQQASASTPRTLTAGAHTHPGSLKHDASPLAREAQIGGLMIT